MNVNEILHTEFSEGFIGKMRNRMIMSFYKYGPLVKNVCRENKEDNCDPIDNLLVRLEKYKETGNTEWLVDAANCAMIEFMHPQHKNAHFRATDSVESPGLSNISFREVEELNEKNKEAL